MKTIKAVLFHVILFLLLSPSLYAEPLKAITQDGKTVFLYENGSWSYTSDLQGGINNKTTLSNEEAITVINDYRKLPALIPSSRYQAYNNDPMFQMIDDLFQKGYVIKTSTKAPPHGWYLSTITGRYNDLFESLYWRPEGDAYFLFIYASKKNIKEIKSILIDTDNKTAKVDVVFQEKFTKDFIDLKAKYPKIFGEERTYKARYILKKWDKGWRVESETDYN